MTQLDLFGAPALATPTPTPTPTATAPPGERPAGAPPAAPSSPPLSLPDVDLDGDGEHLVVCPSRVTGSMDAVRVTRSTAASVARQLIALEVLAAHLYRVEPTGAWTLLDPWRPTCPGT